MGALAAPATARPRLRARVESLTAVQILVVSLLIVAGATGVAGIVTYAIHVDLQAAYPGKTPFAFNVGLALCLLVAGVALDGRRVARVLGAIAALIAAWTLAEYVFGVNLGIDKLFVDPYRPHVVTPHPGRMAPNTAIGLMLAGLALTVRSRWAVAIAGVPFLLGLVAALGYSDPAAKGLASIGQSVNMALPTAVGICATALAFLLRRELPFFSRKSVGGTLTRRLAPIIVLVPMVGSALLLYGIRDQVFTPAAGIWLATVLSVLTALVLLLWTSHVADTHEAKAEASGSLHAETAVNLEEGLCLRRESDGVVISVNPALERIFGYAPGVLPGSRTRLLTELNESIMREGLARVGRWTGEIETVRADGQRFWCSVKASTFTHPEYGVVRVALYHDVTARLEAEAWRRHAEDQRTEALVELERSNRELEQFAHVASHDLSEPLRVIGGFVGLLERRYGGQLDEDADRFIGATVSGVERMQALIDALLAYSRVGSGELHWEPVDMGAAAESVVKMLGERIEEAGATVSVGPLPTVAGDPVLIERVFQNLISNALKFTDGAPPAIEVSAEASDADWTFHVADNGVGIAPEHSEKVFGMFQRLQGREKPGTGIGLAITRRIVEKHGGRVWVEPGTAVGTVFSFTMPMDTPTS